MSVLPQDERAAGRAPFGAFRWLGGAIALAIAALGSSHTLGCATGDSGAAPGLLRSGDANTGEWDADIESGSIESGTGSEAGSGSGSSSSSSSGSSSGSGMDATSSGTDANATDAGGAVPPTLVATQQVCKLINGAAEGDPTANKASTLANLAGTELGIPVEANGTLYFLFGDTHGNQIIWQPGQSLPDALGYSLDSATTLAATPNLLCSDLRFLTLSPASSLGPTADPSIVADFAAIAMSPPSGGTLGTYIHNPSGASPNWFDNLPGTSEVPSGAFAYGNDLYAFYTTVSAPNNTTMVASYLTKWTAPSPQSAPSFNILYGVNERVGTSSPLNGNFINIAAETSGNYLYLFGTGQFRQSPVYLARKLLTSLATAGGFDLYDAASGTWGPSLGAPIVTTPGYGETSVRYFSAINRWVFLAEDLDSHTQIVARFADQPEGPWSSPVVVDDMMDPTFIAKYCCKTTCTGEQMIQCSQSAFYGAYLLPDLTVQSNGSFTVTYTLSTGNPYNVVLMQATFSG